MDKLVESLAGLGRQCCPAAADRTARPILDRLLKPNKAWVLSALSLLVRVVVSSVLGLRDARAAKASPRRPWLDTLITDLILTGGTKAINDLNKHIGYRKEAARRQVEGLG
jgi:hypothetical protein